MLRLPRAFAVASFAFASAGCTSSATLDATSEAATDATIDTADASDAVSDGLDVPGIDCGQNDDPCPACCFVLRYGDGAAVTYPDGAPKCVC